MNPALTDVMPGVSCVSCHVMCHCSVLSVVPQSWCVLFADLAWQREFWKTTVCTRWVRQWRCWWWSAGADLLSLGGRRSWQVDPAGSDSRGKGEWGGKWVNVVFRIKLMWVRDGLGRFSDTGHMICVACMEAGSEVGWRNGLIGWDLVIPITNGRFSQNLRFHCSLLVRIVYFASRWQPSKLQLSSFWRSGSDLNMVIGDILVRFNRSNSNTNLLLEITNTFSFDSKHPKMWWIAHKITSFSKKLRVPATFVGVLKQIYIDFELWIREGRYPQVFLE